jgi:hypothetical protein
MFKEVYLQGKIGTLKQAGKKPTLKNNLSQPI